MQDVYGPVSAFGISVLCAALTQGVKLFTGWDGWKILLVNLAWNLAWQSSWHLLVNGVTPITVYEALFYSFLGAATSSGLYSGVKTVAAEYRAKRAQSQTKDDFPL